MTVVVTHTTPADSSFSTTGAAAWNANHTLTGVGTMAGQDANAVAITGGSISGVTGVVASVTGTAPVVSSGGATPAISMAAATTSVDGYLTSTDWNTFNGKQAALVSGTNIKTVNSNSLLGSGNVSVGTVTSVSGTGTVNGLSLSGTVTSSGNLTFGGTLDLSSPPAIGGTTPAAGTFTTLIGGGGSANYEQITGGATTKAVQFQSLGTDTNISLAVQTKGTGAIDLAAGSSGVNISNGGTVTAITRTAAGVSYTSPPAIAITAPTTAGGVQATATCTVSLQTIAVTAGGSGYSVNDVLTLVGGTGTAATVTVATLSGSAVATVNITTTGLYSVIPTNPISVTGGTGTGATFTASSYAISSTFTITNAGSGYVEQPTVTFSGGGGSGAAAYASVGSGTVVRSLGGSMDFYMPSGPNFRIGDAGATSTYYWQAIGGAFNGILRGGGSTQNALIQTGGTGGVSLQTNNGAQTQMVVSHTASAVNYVQVTGAATGGKPIISAQGSDAAVQLQINAKGGSSIGFSGNGTNTAFGIGHVSSATNYLNVSPSIAGAAPILAALGTDADVSLSLVPKGLGIVLMNQQTPTAVTATGTLTIANLLTQIITSTSAVAVALTLPTGTLSDAGVSGGTSAVNTSFNWSIINTGSAVGDVTLVAGTAHTIVGSATVAVGTTGSFRSRKTATNTFVTYRV